jgi:hypothetical protein
MTILYGILGVIFTFFIFVGIISEFLNEHKSDPEVNRRRREHRSARWGDDDAGDTMYVDAFVTSEVLDDLDTMFH